MKTRSIGIAAVLTLLTLVPGCIRPVGPGDLKRELSAEAGVELNKEVGVTVTRSGIWLARQIMRMTDEPLPQLKGLRRVEVGVYRVESQRRNFDPAAGLDLNRFADWSPMVRMREDGEDVAVLTREKNGSIRNMLVVVAGEDEWVLVRLSGRLDRVIESSLQFAFDEIDRPELYDRTQDAMDEESDGDGSEDSGGTWVVEAADRDDG